MELTDQDILFKAFLNRDKQYEGKFYAGIITTGIFCKTTCLAKKPKEENTRFYKTTKEAIVNGYRPCKICKPMIVAQETPEYINELLQEVAENPGIRLKDYDLICKNMKPENVRKWFQDNHDLTFQDYLRILRINNRFGTVLYDDKKSITNTRENRVVIRRFSTPIGPMLAGASDNGICLLEFMERRMLETQLSRLEKYISPNLVPGNSHLFRMLNNQLSEYFAGNRKEFDILLDLRGTEFQEKVWSVLQTIPYGGTRSYQDMALKINNPKAIRAVAKANGDNRIAIIVPCHRVIGKDGSMTGYGGKIWRKEYLLKLESNG